MNLSHWCSYCHSIWIKIIYFTTEHFDVNTGLTLCPLTIYMMPQKSPEIWFQWLVAWILIIYWRTLTIVNVFRHRAGSFFYYLIIFIYKYAICCTDFLTYSISYLTSSLSIRTSKLSRCESRLVWDMFVFWWPHFHQSHRNRLVYVLQPWLVYVHHRVLVSC